MDRKLPGMHYQKPEPTPTRHSAFEMSLMGFQEETLPGTAAIPKAGELCPNCQSTPIDYDGLLNLSCPKCGYTLAGCFT